MKEIPLTQGKTAFVDDEDFDFLSAYKWHALPHGRTWYARRNIRVNGKQTPKYLHQFLCPGNKEVDHRDGDGLNCQKKNLRPATRAQQSANRDKFQNCSSKFKGVYWNKQTQCWRASIRVAGKLRCLGLYVVETEAGLAYDSAALKSFGDFAKLNFPKYPHVLRGTRAYMIGAMQYKNGQGWRQEVESKLRVLGMVLFNPYRKPFLHDIPEDEKARERLLGMMSIGNYDRVAEWMKEIRNHDLRLVDISDFLIAYIDPRIVSYGTQEELTIAIREKKPVFVIVEGGKKNTPLWLMAMLPHKYIYDSVDDVIDTIKQIDSGQIELPSDHWKLLKPELR